MAAVLDQDKPKASKSEAFVEKQIEQARGRIRALDFFQTGLILLIASLVFAFVLLLIDRAYETPRGLGWAVVSIWVLGLAGYVWATLFRSSRRHINPFYAAHQVEQTIPGAKNSVVNYVDLQDDESVPASVKASIGARAAKDMKQVDLNQAIQKKQVLWLAGFAGAAFIAVLIACFLPATRTTMVLVSPKGGSTTVVQGEDVFFKVELKGRIPQKGQPDAARVRIWYNPEDPGNFEERPLEPIEGEHNCFGQTVPAKQVRNGFFYQIFAGNAKSPAYEVKLRIIPQFTGTWEVRYVYPGYLNLEPETKGDPNLVGYYNTKVTLTAHANRPVQSAVLEIDGQPQSYPGNSVANDPESMRFDFPITRNGRYRIRFVTTDGHKNPDPQWFRISLVDPKPVLRFFDISYDYPKYLRFDNVSVKQVRDPNLEVNRGTRVTLVAHANRPIKQAFIQMEGVEVPLHGVPVDGEPMQRMFKLPALMKDGAYRVWFSPDTGEADGEPRVFSIRIIGDESPKVEITKPQQEETEVAANGILPVEGIATDDHGLARLNLRFEVVKPAPNMPLAPKPYRGGVSFKRESDGSYPNRIDYKEVVELAKLKADGEAGARFSVQPEMVIEYWLEATDNCDVPPGPNSSISRKFRIKVLPPEMNEMKKKEQDKEKQNLEQEKKQHEQQQDQKNANEKRDPQQPKQKNEPQPGDMGEAGGEPGQNQKVDPKGGKGMGMGNMQPNMDPNMGDPAAEADLKKREEELKNLLGKNDPMGAKKDMPMSDKNDPMGDKKDMPMDPKKSEPKQDPMTEAKMPEAKSEPKKDDKADPRQLPKPEEVEKLADKLNSLDKKEHQEAREQIKKNIEQARNDPRKPEEAQKQLDEHRKKLDEPQRKEFDEALERVAREVQNLQREQRVKDAVDKITSGDKQKQQQGQQELENELRDPKTREETERQLQNLAGDMGTERQQQIGDAMNLAKENAKNPPKKGPPQPPMPKEKEEDDVDRLAKKRQKGSEEEKKAAQERLEEMLRDPKTRDQVQKQLEDYKNNIKDKQERDDFEKTVKDIAENAKKDPAAQKADQIQKLAEQLKSDDKKEREAAQKQLEETLKQADKDPKAREEAQKQLKDARDSIKDPMKQERFDQAVKEINEAVQKHRQEQAVAQKKLKEDLDNVARDLNSKDPAKQQAAQQKLEDMLKDPKTREQVKDELDNIKKNAGDAQAKENIEKATEQAMDNIARKEGLEKIAQDLNSKDSDRQKEAQQKLEDKLADPKTRDQVKNDLDKLKEGQKDQQARDNIDKAVGQAEKNIAQNKQEAEKIANDLNSKDPAKQKAAQQKLEEMLKDPAKREQVRKELDKIKQGAGDPQTKENIEKATEKAMEDIARKEGLEKIAQDLNSKDPAKQDAARQKLEDKLGDPKTRDQVKNDLEKLKEALKDPQAKDNVDKAVEQAEKNIAQNKQEAGKLAQDLTGKDEGKRKDAQDKLEKMLQDPKTREQVKKELDKIKDGLGDDQAKAKIDEAIKNAEKNNLAKKAEPGEPKKEDLERIARDLNSKDPAKQEKAEQQLRDALKDPKSRDKVEKELNDIKNRLNDPGERQTLTDALNKAKDDIAKSEKPLDPKEIEKLVKEMMSKDPKQAAAAKKKLDEMLNDPAQRDRLAKAIEELMKNVKDRPGEKGLEDQLKDIKDHLAKKFDPDGSGKTGHIDAHKGKKSGDITSQPAKEGPLADLKNKVKSGELLLEEFKRNITNEEFRKKLGWTDEQLAEFQRKYEQQVANLKKQLELSEKGEMPWPREAGTGGSKLNTGPEKTSIDPRDGSNPLQGGKYIAPPGFGDPYKRFTEDLSGVRPPLPESKK